MKPKKNGVKLEKKEGAEAVKATSDKKVKGVKKEPTNSVAFQQTNNTSKESTNGSDNARGSKTKKKKTLIHHDIKKLLKAKTEDIIRGQPTEVKRCFEALYDQIDVSDSGGITKEEIQSLIKKETNITLSLNQVQDVLLDLDLKGTGDIEFDEFIYTLSHPENYVRLLSNDDIKVLSRQPTRLTHNILQAYAKQSSTLCDATSIFFRALKSACQQDSFNALRNYYRNRLRKLNDHVIHDWSAGQRCIGLSDQKMLKRYETIQGELLRQRVNFCKDNSYRSSPYARPLEWGLLTLRQAIKERYNKVHDLKHKHTPPERRVKLSDFDVTPKVVPLPKYCIKKRSPLKRTFNYDQLADIRVKVDDIANVYYSELKNVARESSRIIKRDLAVDEIKQASSRQNFNWTFKAYCAPFVVSPWIPMPSPTLQASFTPLGKSKLSSVKT